MAWRIAAAFLALWFAAAAQNRGLSVEELDRFFESEAQLHHSDKEVAAFLKQTRLRERLDDAALATLDERFHPGPQTQAALRKLRDATRDLPAAKPFAAAMPAPQKPAPSPDEQKAVLEEVQRNALAYSANLPDFVCIEKEVRWQAREAPQPAWRQVDELDKRLTYFDQKEDYKPFLHNNRPVTGRDLKSFGGAQSFGDFGSMLRQIFEPQSHAEFTWVKWDRLRNRATMVFGYRVALENSRYEILAGGDRSTTAAYHGEIQVETATRKVLRVSVIAEKIPPDFPVESASDVLDYEYQEIAGHSFLLPLDATILMSGDGMVTRNEKQFVGYNKYSADAAITYDVPKTDCTDPKNKSLKECTGHRP